MLRILAALLIPTAIFFSLEFGASGEELAAGKLPLGERTPTVPAPAGLKDPEGRYSLHDAEGGLVRLDRQTGAVSFCYQAGKGWRCEAAGDDIAACEQRSAALDARIRLMEERLTALLKQLPEDKDSADSRFNLPDRKDVDRMLTYLEDVMSRLVERMKALTEDKKDGRKI